MQFLLQPQLQVMKELWAADKLSVMGNLKFQQVKQNPPLALNICHMVDFCIGVDILFANFKNKLKNKVDSNHFYRAKSVHISTWNIVGCSKVVLFRA
jgi:hypothetical protein